MSPNSGVSHEVAVIMNMKQVLLFVVLWGAAQWGVASPVKYVIDPAQTVINFNWHYFGRESPKASFSEPAGVIYLNVESPLQSSAEVSIPVRTLSTFMAAIDRELLNSGNFFKPELHPNITFRSTGIAMPTATNAGFQIQGVLTANGISQPVVLQAKPVGLAPDELPGKVMTVEASTRFQRSQFGMTRMLGLVSDEMLISLLVVAVRED